MGQAALVVSLALAVGVAIFAVQNGGPVTVRFAVWAVDTSLVVVILIAAAAGAAGASLLGLPGWLRNRRRLRQQARELEKLRASQPPSSPPAR